MVDLLSDNSKFKKSESDLTLRREGQLQRFLRKLKKNGLLDCNIYREIYATVPNQLGYMVYLNCIKSKIPKLSHLLSDPLCHL